MTTTTADLALVATFVVVGFVAGGLAHSLVLDSYGAYMLTDAVSIALTIVVGRLAARPARGHYTFGLNRAEILVAQVNGACLVVLAGWLGYSAVRHLLSPSPVRGWVVATTALVGLVVTRTGGTPAARCGARRATRSRSSRSPWPGRSWWSPRTTGRTPSPPSPWSR